MVVAVLSAAAGAVMVGSGLFWAGSLLVWGGRVNEGQVGSHVWAGTTAMAARARNLGVGMVVAGAVGLGPFVWLMAVVRA